MIVISNTGPLIALAKLNRLDLLQKLVPDGVFIPPIIQRELWAKTGFESAALEAALDSFIQIRKPENVPLPLIWSQCIWMKVKSKLYASLPHSANRYLCCWMTMPDARPQNGWG
jgi:hypothetical protein